ncbi:MAG: AAA family ATPase [Pelagimonas sp.]|jgi:adenylate kinase family enzyme|nr:AAA family ATPase [Pelagimonas sp.]MCV6596146.1 AAA family ATPase [Mangrovicoccus sp.]
MKRVMIVGQPGGGKSWLARQMGARTGLPVYHMDQIHWMSGWVERPFEDKLRMATEVENSDRWIFEGGYAVTQAHRLSRADTLVVLDIPFALRVWRVFWRTLRDYGRTRPDLPEGCPENFALEFWQYIWKTRRTVRQRNLSLLDQAGPETTCHVLRSRQDVADFLKTLDGSRKSGQ